MSVAMAAVGWRLAARSDDGSAGLPDIVFPPSLVLVHEQAFRDDICSDGCPSINRIYRSDQSREATERNVRAALESAATSAQGTSGSVADRRGLAPVPCGRWRHHVV